MKRSAYEITLIALLAICAAAYAAVQVYIWVRVGRSSRLRAPSPTAKHP